VGGSNWSDEDAFMQGVFQEADHIRSQPDHGLSSTRQVYSVAAARQIEKRLVFQYRLATRGAAVLAIYVGAHSWWESGAFTSSLAPMAITMLLYTAVVFRLTRRARWAGFSIGPYAGHEEGAWRRAQGGIHLLTLSGAIMLSSLFFWAVCVSWAFPLT
jgi:hypothetical protein